MHGERPTNDASDADGMNVSAVKQLPPDEVFELLAHGTRFSILEHLNNSNGGLTFAELRARVGIDDPGRFNYHLQKLTGRFVRKDSDSYELTGSGRRLVGAVLSGTYTKALSGGRISMNAACLNCGEPMETRFEQDEVSIYCPACGMTYTEVELSPGVLEGHSREEVPKVVDRWLRRNQAAAERGFCYNCDGRIETTVETVSEEESMDCVDAPAPHVTVRYDCGRCNLQWYSAVPVALLSHPAVVSFHYEHGIDVRDVRPWELDWPRPGVSTVTNQQPLRIEVPISLDEETLVLKVDASLEVVGEQLQ